MKPIDELDERAASSLLNSKEGAELRCATVGMGCFWSPEARFGALPGIVRTQTGYAGGNSLNPTYKELGEHTETVQMYYDESILPYEAIVRTFWEHHNPSNINGYKGRQYQSLIFYHDDDQKAAVDAELERRQKNGLGKPDTEILPYAEFHQAEARHQKYYVRRFPNAVAALQSLAGTGETEAWMETTIAARLNGIAKGYSSMDRLRGELAAWPMPEAERDVLLRTLSSIRW